MGRDDKKHPPLSDEDAELWSRVAAQAEPLPRFGARAMLKRAASAPQNRRLRPPPPENLPNRKALTLQSQQQKRHPPGAEKIANARHAP